MFIALVFHIGMYLQRLELLLKMLIQVDFTVKSSLFLSEGYPGCPNIIFKK